MTEYDGAERSATERLRQLLDKRGVKWGRLVDSRGIIGTFWWVNHDQCSALEGADDIPIGKLSVQANLTPEQAVEATLGRGTCKVEYVSEWMGWHCKACDVLWQGLRDQVPHYCPSCGRRVES